MVSYTKIILSGKAILALIAVMVIATVAATFSFTQHFPSIPATAPPAVLTSNCGSGATGGLLVTSTTSVVAGGSVTGYILFTCPNGVAAITSSANGGVATPSFTLPAGYSILGTVAHTAGVTTCTGASSILSSGTPVTFSAGENLDYCASYTNVAATGLAGFDISWNG